MSGKTVQTGTVLDRIVADEKEDVAERKKENPVSKLQERINLFGSQVSLVDSLLRGPKWPRLGGEKIQLIAEIKKGSPSKKRFPVEVLPMSLSLEYSQWGAAAISVLTNRRHFFGALTDLLNVREAQEERYSVGRPALLRKDFLFDPYHLWEARGLGADAALLIVAILEPDQLRDLIQQAGELDMDALVEVHNEQEVELALTAGAELIGINNRDLRTFDVDLATTERLRPLIPEGKCVVSESGISSRQDVERLVAAYIQAILVGEALITAKNRQAKARELLV